jgi:hypothetical protein
MMLALERTATLREIQGKTEAIIRAKPFGGAVRITDPQEFGRMIGGFRFDSECSRLEGDLRTHIPPASWEKLKEICWEHYHDPDRGILDTNPERELSEEFEDSLHVSITRDQYQIKSRQIIIEDLPVETDSVRSAGQPTVRVYYLFEAWIRSPKLISMMLANSKLYTDDDLQKLAWHDSQQGGRGRANAILTVRLDDLTAVYRSFPIDMRSGSICVEGHQLNSNVVAILEEVDQTRYKRFIG